MGQPVCCENAKLKMQNAKSVKVGGFRRVGILTVGRGLVSRRVAKKYPQLAVTLSEAEQRGAQSNGSHLCEETRRRFYLTFPFGEGAEQREADEVLFKN